MLASLFRLCCFLLAVGLCSLPARAGDPPLRLLVVPFNSPQTLIRSLQPLTTHLERQLGRKILVYTSPSYAAHVRQLLAGDFDLAITAPHFSVMAEEKGMHILYRYTAELTPLFIVPLDKAQAGVGQLRGKTIATASRSALMLLSGLEWLEKQGLELDRDFRVQEYPSHAAAITAVANGTADATFVARTVLQQNSAELQAAVHAREIGVALPQVCTLIHPHIDAAESERIRRALAAFPATAAGQKFFRDTGYGGYAPFTAADRAQLRRYTSLTRRLLELP